MTRPLLGDKARLIFEEIERTLEESKTLAIRGVIDVYEDHKFEAADKLQTISDGCAYAARLATLARAGQLNEAEDLIIERAIARKKESR